MTRGRPRKTDPNEVLETSMKVFWEKGYDATSMNDLVAATGMAKPGLYANFGDKETLFNTALTHYVKILGNQMEEDLATSTDPLPVVIRRYLETVANANLDPDGPCGCFFVNSLVESSHAPETTEKLTRRLDAERRQALVDRFRRARAAGELPADVDTEALGEFFAGQVLALAVMARSGIDRQASERFINVAMTALPDKN
ncbi:MAG: TetR/AcrR family transcriptional regulator [Alphaproteobacteria bacterium]